MKVILIQSFLTLAFAVVSFAKEADGQGVLDQKISVNIKNENFKTALRKISLQAGIRFSYQRNTIPDKEKISVSSKEQTLGEIFNSLFQPYHISYEVIGKQVVLKKKKLFNLIRLVENENSNELAFFKPIKGTIKDAQGNPVANVSVSVKGTVKGTSADANGNFEIDANEGDVLIISGVGFETTEVRVGSDAIVSVVLKQSEKKLDEVIVVGYGTQKKVTVTGAVTQVKGSDLDKSPTTNLSNALAGRLPGITAMQRSGEPGYDGSTIRIRGTNTLGNSSPLVVIDGIPDRAGGLERLNPADIESMSVLKDASAAIYGARAANGVILITTKQGKTGKPIVSYDFNKGWQQPTVLPEMGNSSQYAELLNEQALFNNDIPYQEWTAAWDAFKATGSYTKLAGGKVNAYYTPDDIKKFADGSSPFTHPNTDWYKTVFKDWSGQQQHSLQVSGGSENVKYLASLGYQQQDAFYKNSATGYKQYDLRLNLEAKVNKYITTNFGITGREEYRFFPTVDAGAIFRMLIRGKPTEIAKWPNGLPGIDIENGHNPVAITTGTTGYDRDRRDYIQTNGQVDITNPWIKGLKLTLQGAVDKYIRRTKRYATPWSLYTWDKVSFEADGVTPKLTKTVRSTFTDPQLTQSDEMELRINLVAMLNYERTINDDHTIGVMAGVQKETREGDNFNAFRRNFISPNLQVLNVGGTPQQTVGGSGYERARLSYFGRAAYNFKEKYMAEFLWRYDGSYIFPESGQFGFFPGILVGWNITKEDFMQSVGFLNNLKIRASYGKMGNDLVEFNGVLQEYAFLPLYNLGNRVVDGQVVRSLTEPRVENPYFTWEEANNANIGLEGAILNNKIFFEFDVFKNDRKQILIPPGSAPQSSGISRRLPPVNAGEVTNKGFELNVGYNGQIGDVAFRVSVNGAYTKNKVVFWDEPSGTPAHQKATGHPFGTNGYAFLAYQYDGVFKDAAEIAANQINYSAATGTLRPGDMKFKDISGPDGKPDGKITSLDQVRLDKTRDPKFTGGFNLNVSYKSFDLSALFQGAAGGFQLINFNETGEFGNWLDYSYNNRWSVENPSSVHPRLVSRTNTYYTGGFRNNTYWLRNNNYLRFKNIELGYTLAPDILRKIGISKFRVYASGLNLITWEKMDIWDPEGTAENGYVYPQAKIISLGARVTF